MEDFCIQYTYNQLAFFFSISKWRGQVLFDYQHAIVTEGNRAYEIGVITKEIYIKTLKRACQLLEESMKCFKHDEPEQEKMVGKALSEIKEVLFFSDFL